jgi:antitoxin FitA
MTTLTIRNLDERLKRSLRLRAAGHGRSMEQEVRVILADALASPQPNPDGAAWLQRVRQRFQGLEGADWSVLARHEASERELPRFEA